MRRTLLLIALLGVGGCYPHYLITVHDTVTTRDYIAFQYNAESGVAQPPEALKAHAKRYCASLKKRADMAAADLADSLRTGGAFWTVTFPCVG